MIIETKYSLGDRVYMITSNIVARDTKCTACDGKAKLLLGNEYFSCPKCYGRGLLSKYHDEGWHICDVYTIGYICPIVDSKLGGNAVYDVEYMCHETGIGSGSVYHEKDLFASAEEAQAECDKRNKGL